MNKFIIRMLDPTNLWPMAMLVVFIPMGFLGKQNFLQYMLLAIIYTGFLFFVMGCACAYYSLLRFRPMYALGFDRRDGSFFSEAEHKMFRNTMDDFIVEHQTIQARIFLYLWTISELAIYWWYL